MSRASRGVCRAASSTKFIQHWFVALRHGMGTVDVSRFSFVGSTSLLFVPPCCVGLFCICVLIHSGHFVTFLFIMNRPQSRHIPRLLILWVTVFACCVSCWHSLQISCWALFIWNCPHWGQIRLPGVLSNGLMFRSCISSCLASSSASNIASYMSSSSSFVREVSPVHGSSSVVLFRVVPFFASSSVSNIILYMSSSSSLNCPGRSSICVFSCVVLCALFGVCVCAGIFGSGGGACSCSVRGCDVRHSIGRWVVVCVAPRLVFMLFSVNVFIGDTLVLSTYSSCSSVGGLVVERYLVSPVCALLIMYVCWLEVDILVRQYSPGGRATVCWTCWGIFMLSPGFQFGVSSEFVLRPPFGCVFVIGVRPYFEVYD